MTITRRDALKYFLTGTVGGVLMGWEGHKWWAERKATPRSMEVSSLREAFERWPNAEYLVLDDLAPNGHSHRWYPTNRTSEFELDSIVGGEELSPGVFIRRIVFIKFKEGGDYYRGVADIYGITRAEAKRRTFASLYGGELTMQDFVDADKGNMNRWGIVKAEGTVTGRIKSPARNWVSAMRKQDKFIMNFEEIEKRVLLARNK